jgi:uncharacterized membrane protein YeaQ/YmgE (transglycosylase-associated protein family)
VSSAVFFGIVAEILFGLLGAVIGLLILAIFKVRGNKK